MFGRSKKAEPPAAPEAGTVPSGSVRMTARVTGHVQGVGFRWTVMSVAQPLGLLGYAQNEYNGDVQVVAEGTTTACRELLGWLDGTGARTPRRPGRVDSVSASWGAAQGGFHRFSVR